MNTAELIVELVLAGLLTLVALMAPAVAAGALSIELTSETIVIVIALSFALGVVVDRAADTVLDRWLGFLRLRAAWIGRIKSERDRLIGARQLRDSLPEAWMRTHVLQHGSEALTHQFDQLRVRFRVARDLVVLTPALAVSIAAAIVLRDRGEPSALVALLPLWQLSVLTVLVVLADVGIHGDQKLKWFKAPRTDGDDDKQPKDGRTSLEGPAIWFVAQLVPASWLLFTAPLAVLPQTAALFAGGALTTLLAIHAWRRLFHTQLTLLWDFCHAHRRPALRAACAAPDDRSPSHN